MLRDFTNTPPVDTAEEEEPDDINEMPVPGRRLKTKMLVRREVALVDTRQADRQKRAVAEAWQPRLTGRPQVKPLPQR